MAATLPSAAASPTTSKCLAISTPATMPKAASSAVAAADSTATAIRPLSLSKSSQLSGSSIKHQLPDPSILSFPIAESMVLTTEYKKSLKSLVDEEIILPLPKSDSQMGRISPVSIDSGFESSFPSSPDSSSGENRNLLLQKIETPSVVETESDCKLNVQGNRHAAISSVASTSTTTSEMGSDLLDVIMFSANQGSNDSLGMECDGSLQKLNIDISSLSVEKFSTPDSTQDTSSSVEADILSTSEKESSCTSSIHCDSTKIDNEFCEYPSTSVASSSSYTPSVAHSVSDDTEDSEFFCLWDHCGQQFSSELELFNHVMKGHFECLHPLEDTTTLKRLKAGAKCRAKNLMCKWDNCEMGLSRGDPSKQFAWLKEHFFTRHFRKAKPYCCLIDGCSARFSFKRALEDHLRTGHDKVKRTDTGKRKKPKAESCLEWTPLPYYPPDPKNDFLDKATIEFMVMRLRKYEMIQNPQFVPRPPPGPRGGAAYRKRKRILTWDIVSFEEFFKQEVERKKREIDSGVPQVGEYAAKEWKRIFSKII